MIRSRRRLRVADEGQSARIQPMLDRAFSFSRPGRSASRLVETQPSRGGAMPADFELQSRDTDRLFARMGRADRCRPGRSHGTHLGALQGRFARRRLGAALGLQRRRQRGRRVDRRRSTGGRRKSLAALLRSRLHRVHRRTVRAGAHVPGLRKPEDRSRRASPAPLRMRTPSSPASASAWASPSERAPAARQLELQSRRMELAPQARPASAPASRRKRPVSLMFHASVAIGTAVALRDAVTDRWAAGNQNH